MLLNNLLVLKVFIIIFYPKKHPSHAQKIKNELNGIFSCNSNLTTSYVHMYVCDHNPIYLSNQ